MVTAPVRGPKAPILIVSFVTPGSAWATDASAQKPAANPIHVAAGFEWVWLI
jgi:hypothetical protein